MKVTVTSDGSVDLVQVGDLWLPSVFETSLDKEDGSSPRVNLRFEMHGGTHQCRSAELVSIENGREVLASDLRGVKIEDFLEMAARFVAMDAVVERQADGTSTKLSPVTTQAGQRHAVSQIRAVRKEARRRVTDEMLRDVARVYRENIDDNPTEAVAEYTGRAHRTATLYVKLAREAGLLGPAIVGKAGEQ